MEHTPGPWRIEERQGHAWTPRYVVVGPTYEERIAVISLNGAPNGVSSVALANANLIATTPDLLALLKKLRDEFQALFDIANMTGPIETKASAFEKLVTEIDEVLTNAQELA